MAVAGQKEFDLIIVGGGPLGCAVARDAVGRGLRVLLCESDDLGGDFAHQLVITGVARDLPRQEPEPPADARAHPHLADYEKAFAAGRWFDRILRMSEKPSPQRPLNPFRFAMLSARDAAERGGTILPHTRALDAKRASGRWRVRVTGGSGHVEHATARVLVDTTRAGIQTGDPVAPHHPPQDPCTIAVFGAEAPRPEGTVLFSYPFDHDLTVMGYAETLTRDDAPGALWLSGPVPMPARPPSLFMLSSGPEGDVPVLRPAQIAACHARRVAEMLVAEMVPFVRMIGKPWTANTPLPGGDFEPSRRLDMVDELAREFPRADRAHLGRLFAQYGTEARDILLAPQGAKFGGGLTEAEVRWLKAREWAASADDILWRRTQLGLIARPETVRALDSWLQIYG